MNVSISGEAAGLRPPKQRVGNASPRVDQLFGKQRRDCVRKKKERHAHVVENFYSVCIYNNYYISEVTRRHEFEMRTMSPSTDELNGEAKSSRQ